MRSHHIAAIAAIALLGGCGPTEREVGGLLLLALPAMVLFGGLLQLGYKALWRAAIDGESPRFDPRPSGWLFGASVLLLLVPLIGDAVSDEVAVALWLAGSSYALYLLLAMRITVGSARRYAWAALAPWVLMVPLAVVLALFGSATDDGSGFGLYYILPGYAGIVPGGVAALLLIEIAIRNAIKRKREREQEPVFPTARVHLEDEPTPQSPRQFVARSARR
jgi:hypothetical protein